MFTDLLVDSRHLNTHSKPYHCNHSGCSRKFARASDLNRHQSTHKHSTVNYTCQWPRCRSGYNRKDNLRKHIIHDHSNTANLKDDVGRTPLHYVSSKQSAILLLNYGADPNALDGSGLKPLYTASTNEQEDLAQLLLQQTTDLGHANSRGGTGLHAAARFANYTILKLLLEKGLDVNAKDKSGRTPLLEAKYAEMGYPRFQTMTLLIAWGSNIYIEIGSLQETTLSVDIDIYTAQILLESRAEITVKLYGVSVLSLLQQILQEQSFISLGDHCKLKSMTAFYGSDIYAYFFMLYKDLSILLSRQELKDMTALVGKESNKGVPSGLGDTTSLEVREQYQQLTSTSNARSLVYTAQTAIDSDSFCHQIHEYDEDLDIHDWLRSSGTGPFSEPVTIELTPSDRVSAP